MISMTTDSVLPRERAEFWADLVSRHVTPMCIEPAGEQPLSGEVRVRVIGDLGVAQVSGRGVDASHTRKQIGRTLGHLYAACIHLDGEARIGALMESTADIQTAVDGPKIMHQMASYHPREPHWYLPLLGIDPAHQGKGLGGALLKHATDICDPDGLPAYVESSSPRNIPLYERHGFEIMGRIQSGGSPVFTPMVRKPQGRR